MHERRTASGLLKQIAAGRQRVSLRDLTAAFDERAYGLLLLLLAAPNIVPNPIPGLSGMLGVPLIMIAAQLVLGYRRPWLPGWLAGRSVPGEAFHRVVERVFPWLQRAERLLKPRFPWVASLPAERLVAAFCVILAIVIALPIPLGNTGPAIAVSLIALGLFERDGLFVLVGVAVGLVSLAMVSAVVVASAKALMLLLFKLI